MSLHKFTSMTDAPAWAWWRNAKLRSTVDLQSPLVVDLFAGAGGLGLGLEAAGLRTYGFEADADACETYKANLSSSDCVRTRLTAQTSWSHLVGVDVVAGGPPCQPFSGRGRQEGAADTRNGFPAFLAAVETLRPQIFVAENVRGMLFRNKAYLEEVVRDAQAMGYVVEVSLLNAADYGVPQKRERLFVVGRRGGTWRWPAPTVSSPVTVGAALGEAMFSHDVNSRFLTAAQDAYVSRYEIASKCVRPRDLEVDRPARTVTCRNLASATSDMLRVRLPDGRRRMLSLREGARLQSFPDDFAFKGGEASVARQIGNAVPPLMARAVALSVLAHIS